MVVVTSQPHEPRSVREGSLELPSSLSFKEKIKWKYQKSVNALSVRS
jgi:hypothetical protein